MLITKENNIITLNQVTLTNKKDSQSLYEEYSNYNHKNTSIDYEPSKIVVSHTSLLERKFPINLNNPMEGKAQAIITLRNKYFYTLSMLYSILNNKDIDIDLSKLLSPKDLEILIDLTNSFIPSQTLKKLIDEHFHDLSLFIKLYKLLIITPIKNYKQNSQSIEEYLLLDQKSNTNSQILSLSKRLQ